MDTSMKYYENILFNTIQNTFLNHGK